MDNNSPKRRKKNNASNSTSDVVMEDKKWDAVLASDMASGIVNPIRAIVDRIKKPKAPPEKPMIALSLGDPTVHGNLRVPASVEKALIRNISSGKFNGYGPSVGSVDAREAIAERFSTSSCKLCKQDVVIASGCSGAIALVIPTLAGRGDNILLPAPGFSVYGTIAQAHGIEVRYYKLLPQNNWEVDIDSCQALVDKRTRFLLINNPSNPCGSNFTRDHLEKIVAFGRKNRIPLVSDEIYADMVFPGQEFTTLAEVSGDVPVVILGGLAKQYLVPGWRVGWAVVHDRSNCMDKIREGLLLMSQLILGANSLMQSVIRSALLETDKQFYKSLMTTLHEQAMCFSSAIEKLPGLKPITPQGAMYLMVEIKVDELDITDDQDFCQKLLDEEFVFVLPGSCFNAPNFFRVVYCAPKETLLDAAKRIGSFMQRHRKSV